MVGRLVSFLEGPFSGAMLVLGCNPSTFAKFQGYNPTHNTPHLKNPSWFQTLSRISWERRPWGRSNVNQVPVGCGQDSGFLFMNDQRKSRRPAPIPKPTATTTTTTTTTTTKTTKTTKTTTTTTTTTTTKTATTTTTTATTTTTTTTNNNNNNMKMKKHSNQTFKTMGGVFL